ncbi:MAG: hypothetical protein K5839_03165, partial [Treponemataceae bacterium]|nr:hypothetical protein [Treponemataceae bacterium]
IYQKIEISDYVAEIMAKDSKSENKLYGLTFGNELPIMLLPSTVPIEAMIEIAFEKTRNKLRKEEFHDYFQKKIRISNPGKELSAKNFFTQFVDKPSNAIEMIKNAGENFYFWGQLCHFIIQDYAKVKDMTPDDMGVLMSVHFIEVVVASYRSKNQTANRKTDALKTLETLLGNPPYYFSMQEIVKFSDSKGIPLLGQYNQEDLNNYLHEKTTSLENSNLPLILVFKDNQGTTLFIKKEKVMQLVVRLSAVSRDSIIAKIKNEWIAAYKNFTTLDEMKEDKPFQEKLEKCTASIQPILYALLNSNFLSLVNYEANATGTDEYSKTNLFINGKLIPYSDILMIDQNEIIADIKLILPFYYTNPIISRILGFFLKSRTKKTKSGKSKSSSDDFSSFDNDDEEIRAPKVTKSSGNHKDDLKNAVKKIEEQLVPANSSLNHEMSSYLSKWNFQLDKQKRDNLTEDVNCLVRDYIRKVLRTMKGSTFTLERIQHLTEELVASKGLEQIRDKSALSEYIQLYIISLLKNIK